MMAPRKKLPGVLDESVLQNVMPCVKRKKNNGKLRNSALHNLLRRIDRISSLHFVSGFLEGFYFARNLDATLEFLKNKNKFISNHRERMHDIYRSICGNKNANFLFTKSAIGCE